MSDLCYRAFGSTYCVVHNVYWADVDDPEASPRCPGFLTTEPDTSQGDAARRPAEASQNAGPGAQHVRRAAQVVDALWDHPDLGTEDERDGLIWMSDEREMADALRELRKALIHADLAVNRARSDPQTESDEPSTDPDRA